MTRETKLISMSVSGCCMTALSGLDITDLDTLFSWCCPTCGIRVAAVHLPTNNEPPGLEDALTRVFGPPPRDDGCYTWLVERRTIPPWASATDRKIISRWLTLPSRQETTREEYLAQQGAIE